VNIRVNTGDDKAKISIAVMDNKWVPVRCFFGSTYLHYYKTHISCCYALFWHQAVL